MPMFGTARPKPDLSALSDPRPTFGGAPQSLPVDPSPLVGNMPRIPEGGFFSEGGTGRTIAGVLGDALMTLGGGRPIYGPQMARRQEFERQSELEDQRYRRRLGDEWRMFLNKSEYERANPKPVNNDTVADYNFIVERLGPEAGKAFLENKTLPPPFVQKNPDGTSTIYPQGLPRAATPAAPAPGAIEDGYRFKGGNPADPNSWEPVGGAGSGPRPFP